MESGANFAFHRRISQAYSRASESLTLLTGIGLGIAAPPPRSSRFGSLLGSLNGGGQRSGQTKAEQRPIIQSGSTLIHGAQLDETENALTERVSEIQEFRPMNGLEKWKKDERRMKEGWKKDGRRMEESRKENSKGNIWFCSKSNSVFSHERR